MTNELRDYAASLAGTHLAVITGMPGVGKTTLARQLARQVSERGRTFWHTFHEGEGIEVLVWKLAGFLAWHGQQDLWRMLQSAQQTGGRLPPIEILLDYLIQMIRRRGYLLCFDDFQFVADDPLIAQLIEQLRGLMQAGDVSVIIISQRAPVFLDSAVLQPLTGLSSTDIRKLLALNGLSLPDDLVDELFAHTEGNAELLTLAINTLQRTTDPAMFVEHLAESSDIERYLMTELDRRLTKDERAAMGAVALLLGYPGMRDAIEAVLDRGALRQTLSELSSRYLLTVTEGEAGKEYRQHALVQAFYYSLLSRRERQVMHRQAGEYYENEAPDMLKAAGHFLHAEDHERAAQLVTDHTWALINQGQGQPLPQLLAQFSEQRVSAVQRAEINIARGRIYEVLGDNQPARDSYQNALSQLKGLSDSQPVRELSARACRGMAEAMEHESPQEALNWLERGLEAVAESNSSEEAALHVRVGTTKIAIGEYEAALDTLKHGLDLLPPDPSHFRASALGNLGLVYCAQGDIERGKQYYRQALEISERLNDYWRMVGLWHNLGIEMEIAGDWRGAAEEYQRALAQAERLGSTQYQAEVSLALGILNTKRGDFESAHRHLSDCLTIARQRNWQEHLVYGLSSLADLQIREEEWSAAETTLKEAETLALEIDAKPQLPEIYRSWAQVRVAQGACDEARERAEGAINLARELKSEIEEGTGPRVLGMVQFACGERDAALASFEYSLSLLAALDPYEAARTKTQLGLALLPRTDADCARAKIILQEARVAFQELGALRDEATTDVVLRDAKSLG